MRTLALTLTFAVLAGAAPALATEDCVGPGAAFGVVSYQCGDCTMQQKTGQQPVWLFRTEPLVLKTANGSVLQGGDVIEAVDGHPITTAAGAQAFTYPTPGIHEIVARRNGRQVTVQARTMTPCPTGAGLTAPPAERAPVKPRGRFGFALACSSCTRQVGPDGVGYWTFESNPTVGDLDADGPAATAGLRVGDVIVEVEGQPVLQSAGATALSKAERAVSLTLTVRRADGTLRTVTLKARSKD
ncbi:MAG TPA: PDZ domain-containing protein [Vicinamibacterales bacterium]|nr:PDZ domain-containing protein [Vicinamibacterales bacterium]